MSDKTHRAMLRSITAGLMAAAVAMPAFACSHGTRSVRPFHYADVAARCGDSHAWTAPDGYVGPTSAYGAVRVDYGMLSSRARRPAIEAGRSLRTTIYDGRDAAVLRQRVMVPLDELLLPEGPRPVRAGDVPVPPPPVAPRGEDPFRDDAPSSKGPIPDGSGQDSSPPPTFAEPPVGEAAPPAVTPEVEVDDLLDL